MQPTHMLGALGQRLCRKTAVSALHVLASGGARRPNDKDVQCALNRPGATRSRMAYPALPHSHNGRMSPSPQIRSVLQARRTPSSSRRGSISDSRARRVSPVQQLWVPAVAALVGVAVGGVIAVVGVERQIQEERSAEERAIRAEAYLSLVTSADSYAQRTDDVMRVVGEIKGSANPEQVLALNPAFGPWLDARNDFQDSLNRVYVYGSRTGWEAALGLAGALPYAQGNDVELVEVSPSMGDRYRDILRIMCEEATVTPRADCVTTSD